MIHLAKLSMQVVTNRKKVFRKRGHKNAYSKEKTVGEIWT